MYKYLLWDIDGTILDFVAAEKCAIKMLFKKYDLGECTDQMIGVYSNINTKYWQKLERREMTKPEILVGRFKEFFELYGIRTDICEEFNKEYQVALGDFPIFVAGAKEILEKNKGKYIQLAVTNGTKVAQTKKMKTSGLENLFDAIYISEDAGFEKPSTEYFDFVFKNENITDKSQVLIIGDSLTSDMLGGVNFGIDTCWYNPNSLENTKNIPINYEIKTLSEVMKIL